MTESASAADTPGSPSIRGPDMWVPSSISLVCLHSYGKAPFGIGKSTVDDPCSMAILPEPEGKSHNSKIP